MQEHKAVAITIGTDGGPLNALELTNYLKYFRAAYVECLRALEISRLPGNDYPYFDDPKLLAKHVLETGRRVSGYTLHSISTSLLQPEDDLVFYDIQRRNPLDFLLGGVVVAVAAAVVISGGEIKINKDGFHAKVRSLGQGLTDIRKALSKNPASQQGVPVKKPKPPRKNDA